MAFFEPLPDGSFAGTSATAGPWSSAYQHGGPMSALLGRALEQHEPIPDSRIARVTIEILSPVPVAPLTPAVRTLRPGKRVALLEGELTCEGRPVLRARAWRLATAPPDLRPVAHTPPPPPVPSHETLLKIWEGAHVDGYLAAIDWRPVAGVFGEPGPAEVWARPRHSLLPDEPDTPLIRTLTLADSGSGIGADHDPRTWLIINTDLTVALHRDPVGDWISLNSRINSNPAGSGLAETLLSDTRGPVGRSLQTLFIDHQPPA